MLFDTVKKVNHLFDFPLAHSFSSQYRRFCVREGYTYIFTAAATLDICFRPDP